MNNEEFLWVEKYRPKTIDECILPDSIKNKFKEYVNKKEIPNLLLYGSSGTGKTSIAKALCNDVGCDYLFINGSSETGIDTFRSKITDYASSVSLSGGKKVIIIDEAEYMAANSLQPALRAGQEEFSKNCSFIFTCNNKNKIIPAIHSRCASVDFNIKKSDKKKLLVQFFKRVCSILEKEHIEYDKESLAAFVAKWHPDNRRILNELQSYSIQGKIDVGILTQIGDLQLKDLIGYLKEKNYNKVREWVVSNIDTSSEVIYRKIYDGLYDFLQPNSIPQVVLILSKYQYQSGFCNDQEIQLLACLTEIMVESNFK